MIKALFTAYWMYCYGCSGITACGKIADYTQHYVAADFNYWKCGDKITLYYNGWKEYTVMDTGAAIKGKWRFDILVASQADAVDFGKRYLEIKIK